MLSTTLPASIIDPTLAGQRREYFCNVKRPVLDDLIGYKKELDHLTYSVPVFLELLDFLTAKKRYSGLRVYFASYLWDEEDPSSRFIPANYEDNLTLIFVPTTEVGQNGKTIQRDDLKNVFTISHNRLLRLPEPRVVGPKEDTASKWVKHYRNNRLPGLSVNGEKVTGNEAFRETKALWYKIGIFLDNGDEPGLITYIKDLQKDIANPLQAIVPQFACYTDTDTYIDPVTQKRIPLNYQLTLLFVLQQKNEPHQAFGTRHGADDQLRNAARVQAAGATTPGAPGPMLEAQSNSSDTGFPCPPAICGGSLLPAS